MKGAQLEHVTILLVTHGDYGREMVAAAELLVGTMAVDVVMICSTDGRADIERRIRRRVKQQPIERGLLLLVDLCGSTPANVCVDLLRGRADAEVVTGVNLPMLLKIASCEPGSTARRLAEELRKTGQRSMVLGTELANGGGQGGD